MKLQLILVLAIPLSLPGANTAWADLTQPFSLQFDGLDDYVEVPDAPELSGSQQSLTVEAWILPSEYSRGTHFISKYLHWNTKDWGMLINSDGLLGFQRESGPGPGGGNWFVYSSDVVPVNSWSHCAFVFDNDSDMLRLYLNGILTGSRSITVDLPDTSAVVWIGGPGPFYYQRYATEMFSGCIDDVRIWSMARTNEQISNNMLSGSIAGSEAGLVAYWNFDEGSGPIVSDSTVYARNAHLGSTCGYDDNDPAWVAEHSPVIPTPSAVFLGGIGLSVSGWLLRRRRTT